MTQKHTPEPWQQFEHDKRAIVSEEHPNLSLLSIDDDGLGIFFEEKDARRVVACVNACAGIPTEQLESPAIKLAIKSSMSLWMAYTDKKEELEDAIEQRSDLQRELAQVKSAMKAQADGLVKQRDELLSVLVELITAYADEEPSHQGIMDLIVTGADISQARKAIASVKGGTA